MPWAVLVITRPRGIMGLVVRLVELGVASDRRRSLSGPLIH